MNFFRQGGLTKAPKPAYKRLLFAARRRAQVAQLVEHATENRSVGGSIPPLGTIPFTRQGPLSRS